VTFVRTTTAGVRFELENLDAVTRVELFRFVPARMRAGHRTRDIGIQGMDADARLRRVVSSSGIVVRPPLDGIILSRMLADDLELSAGDTLTLELLEGRRDTVEVLVAGTVDDLLGVSGTMSSEGLRRLVGGPELASGAYLSVDAAHLSEVNARIKDMPMVAGVSSPAAALASFETQLAEGLVIAIGFLLSFAGVIAVAVIYNGARISLSERSRELASLQVMGFRRAEVSALLLGEQGLLTLAAIPMGWAIGYALAFVISAAVQTELYRIPLVISARTYAVSALIILVAATLSGLVVRRRVDRLDLIEVLKTRE